MRWRDSHCMNPHEEAIRYAEEHAGGLFPEIPEACRPRLVEITLRALRSPGGSHSGFASWLFDEFATLNLDWRLVANALTGECQRQGFIASRPTGSKVRWMAARQGACGCCQELDKQVYMVVAPDDPDRDWHHHVWRGKSRLDPTAMTGISQGNWPAAGMQHHGCRCAWSPEPDGTCPPGVDPDFDRWLREKLRAVQPSRRIPDARSDAMGRCTAARLKSPP